MRCIFCRGGSSLSRSVEHIVPESLGNMTQILPVGVVCDRCNNYFAREIEKPFIATPYNSSLRFYEMLENKRGRVPLATGLLSPNIPVLVERNPKNRDISVDVPSQFVEQISRSAHGRLLIPLESSPPSGIVLSRFLAKVAVESLAQHLLGNPSLLGEFIDDPQLDKIRDHARRGMTPVWPTHSRRIYAASGEPGTVIHESDFLFTTHQEVYFVLALFGQEFVINLGGPDIEGYKDWLDKNDNKSPLYSGKNTEPIRPSITS
jgi:HNH endonuclease